MAKPRMDLSAFVGKLLEEQDGDVLREGIRVLSQALMEAEVAASIGAERHERTGDRTAYRNGSRTRTWDTRVGTIELAIAASIVVLSAKFVGQLRRVLSRGAA